MITLVIFTGLTMCQTDINISVDSFGAVFTITVHPVHLMNANSAPGGR